MPWNKIVTLLLIMTKITIMITNRIRKNEVVPVRKMERTTKNQIMLIKTILAATVLMHLLKTQ